MSEEDEKTGEHENLIMEEEAKKGNGEKNQEKEEE